MKNIFTWVIVVVMAMMSPSIYAQKTISGIVSDKTSNQPMPLVNVYLPELNFGIVTNEDGEYVLKNLPQGALKIQFSYVGYKTMIEVVDETSTDVVFNVSLEPAVLQAEEVVISGGTYSSQHENAIKIELLNSRELSTFGTPTLMEALSHVPGVDMIAKGTGVAKPVIRGLSMNNVLMLNNGVKLENFQFSENHPYIIDEFGTDRVEIVKGPASLLFGSDAVGGVINVIKEKPAPGGKIIGDFNSQLHSNTNGIVTNLGIRGSKESFFWGLRIGEKSHQDYSEGDGAIIPNTRFNESSLKATLGLKKQFGLFRIYYDYNRPKLGMSVGAAIPYITENGRQNEVWFQDLTNHVISTKNTLFLGTAKIDLNASYQANNRALQTDTTMPAFEMVDMDLHTLSYEAKSTLSLFRESELIIGFQGAYKTNRNNEAPNHVLPDADMNDFGFFALAMNTFFNHLKTQVGIRYDHRSIGTVEETGKPAIDNKYGDVSASFGATYHLNNNFLLRTNIASAYRTPNIAELTQNGMHGVRYEQGNADLQSQRSYEGDLSLHYHTEKVMIDISGFYNRINGYIFIAPTDEYTSSGLLIYRYSQSDSRLYGSEIAVNVLPLDWMLVDATYSWLVGEYDDGSYLPFIPPNKLRAEVRLTRDEVGLLKNAFIKVGGVYAFKQDTPSAYESATEAYALLNAGIGTEIAWNRQTVTVSLLANNLLNETYIDHLSTLKGLGYNNIGRNISLNLTVPFGIR